MNRRGDAATGQKRGKWTEGQPAGRHTPRARRSRHADRPFSRFAAAVVICGALAALGGALASAGEPAWKPAPDPNAQPKPTAADDVSPDAAKLKRLSLEDLMNVEVATVTTASKIEEKATDAPATVLVITAQDIKLRGYSNLKDVLRDLPGMETVEGYYTEIATLVPVRGISGNNKIIVLVNGMRVNPPGGEFFPFGSDFSVRDAEQVEVIYGPGSTLYGQDAISAVINVKTRHKYALGGISGFAEPGETLNGVVGLRVGF